MIKPRSAIARIGVGLAIAAGLSMGAPAASFAQEEFDTSQVSSISQSADAGIATCKNNVDRDFAFQCSGTSATGYRQKDDSSSVCNPIFALTLMVATAISMAAAIEAWWTLETERKQLLSFGYGIGLQSQTYLGQTRESSFGNWIVVGANAPLLASVFFYALPLLAMLAGSWSCLSERLSGYEAQICTRVSRNAYVNVKMLSAFLSAFAVTAIPLLVNFLIVSMLFPAYLPRVDESIYVGLYLHSYFSGLFYSRPLLYVLVYTLFDAVTLGVLSMAVTGLSVVFRSRIKAMVVPYLIMVAWHFVNDWIFSVLSCVGFNCNILNSIRSESLNNWPDIRAGFAEITLLLVFSLVSARFLKRREVV